MEILQYLKTSCTCLNNKNGGPVASPNRHCEI